MGKRFERINSILEQEYLKYNDSFNLIGSANYPFRSVLEAASHPINLNPAEGFPGKRYFPNCENLDDIEEYGISLLKILFNLPEDLEVSLQPHSGTQANHIVFNGILERDDVVLIFRNDSGGHVSHSFFAKKYYKVIEYGVDENGWLNYTELHDLVKKHSPKIVVAGASSYPREIDYKLIGRLCHENGALLLADISHTALYCLEGVHVSPVKYADFITFTTHKTTRGPRSGVIFYRKRYSRLIRKSIFPITQGAPKFSEILAKTIMCIELTKMNREAYIKKVLSYGDYFSDFMVSNGIKVYTGGTDSHLVVLDLQGQEINGLEAELRLESINIFANRNMVPNDPLPPSKSSGLRFGFLTLASLDFSIDDFKKLTQIIFNRLFDNGDASIEDVKKLIGKHTIFNTANEVK